MFIGHGTFIAEIRDYKWLGTVSRASSSERHILELYREVQHICIHVHVYTFTCVSVQLSPNGVLKNIHVHVSRVCYTHVLHVQCHVYTLYMIVCIHVHVHIPTLLTYVHSTCIYEGLRGKVG